MTINKETELAAEVIGWLSDQGWEIYQEVQIYSHGPRVDIVARKDKLTWLIETKMNFSLSLYGQILNWIKYANYASVAVLAGRRNYRAIKHILKMDGIGLITVNRNGGYVIEQMTPKINRNVIINWKDKLEDAHKNFAEAGNTRNKYYTPYQATCLRIVRYVTDYPGCTLKELIEGIDHHYMGEASAKSSIAKWVQLGKIEGIVCKREGRYLKFYPNSAEQAVDE